MEPLDQVAAERIDSILSDIKNLGRYLSVHGRGVAGKRQILCTLHEAGGQETQRELCEYFALKPSSMSEVLAKLESAGYVVRTRDTEDSRKLIVELTAQGRDAAAVELAHRDLFRAWSLGCLDEEEQLRLKELLEKVLTHWEQGNWEELDD